MDCSCVIERLEMRTMQNVHADMGLNWDKEGVRRVCLEEAEDDEEVLEEAKACMQSRREGGS
jgi:hypothetical protein